MTRRNLAVWFGAVLLLSLYSRWHVYAASTGRCSLDGNRIVPTYRVDLMLDGHAIDSFCCVKCAVEWPDVPDAGYWRVRDEVTGKTLDADRACFVESSVVTVPSRQDQTHVFKSWTDALSHVTAFDGYRIQNPLARIEINRGEPDGPVGDEGGQ